MPKPDRPASSHKEAKPAGQVSFAYVTDMFGDDRARALLGSEVYASLRASDSVPTTVVWQMAVDNITRFDDEGLGCTLHPLKKDSYSTVFSAVNQMDTVDEGCRRYSELLPVLPAGIRADVSHRYNGTQISWSFDEEHRDTRQERYLELIAMVLHCVLVWGSRATLTPVHIRLPDRLSSADGSFLSGLSENYTRRGSGVAVTYSSEEAALPLGVRRYQSWAKHETSMFLDITATIQRASLPFGISTTQQVKEILKRENLSLAQAAKRIGVSTATLQRRLSEDDTTFSALSKAVRMGQLEELLKSDMKLDDVAAQLGFSDRRSLWRATIDWLGVSPSQYRSDI